MKLLVIRSSFGLTYKFPTDVYDGRTTYSILPIKEEPVFITRIMKLYKIFILEITLQSRKVYFTLKETDGRVY